MAITYDYSYNIVGDPQGAVTNTSLTSVSLTGLTTGEDYEVRVFQRQEETGAVYLSSAGVATFTAASSSVAIDLPTLTIGATLNAVAQVAAVGVDLGLISHVATLEVVDPFTAFTGNSYNLKVDHIEGASTNYVNDLVSTSHTLTGLIENDNYDVSVQTIERLGGIEYPHVYTPTVSFIPVAPAWTAIGTILSPTTLNSVSPVVESALRVDLGVVTPTVNLETLTAYTVEPVVVNLGLIGHTATLNNVAVFYEGGLLYKLKVVQEGGPTVFVEDIAGVSYALTNLIENETYTVSVIAEDNEVDHNGVTYFTGYSNPLTFLSFLRPVVEVGLPPVSHVATLNPVAALDRILKIQNVVYSQDSGDFELSGTTSHDIQTLTATVDGNPMVVNFSGTVFDATLTVVPLEISSMEELDGHQPLSAGTQILEVR